jgi:phage-related protein
MNSVEFTIIAHVRPDGSVPFQDALFAFAAASESLQAAFEAGLIRMESGSNHRFPLTRYLEDNLFEIRIRKARVFFTFMKGAKIVLLNGFIKDQRKTPTEHLELARKLKEEAMA